VKIVEIGNLRETRAVINADGDRLPRCGIIIEATPDELAALPFNPVYAEVRLVPLDPEADFRNRRSYAERSASNGAGENLYGKGVGR
jgi:hypothetical protein